MTDIRAWYLHGVAAVDLPQDLESLRRLATGSKLSPELLLRTDKWDFLLREGEKVARSGFVRLSKLASTRRGIATGANEFFHLSAARAGQLGLPRSILVPCVGRAADVQGIEFSEDDLASLIANDRRALLATFGSALGPSEKRYICAGENDGIHKRFLLAARKPWYSMERQRRAPIWAAVFGRQGLRFVHNRTQALTLTTFHCVYPFDYSETAVAALTVCLNAPTVQREARAQTRVYGGGLLKFEPRDLLDILVPDLSRVTRATLEALAAEQYRLVTALRSGTKYEDLNWGCVEELIQVAANELQEDQSPSRRPETILDRTQPSLQLVGQTRHADPAGSCCAQPQRLARSRRLQLENLRLWES